MNSRRFPKRSCNKPLQTLIIQVRNLRARSTCRHPHHSVPSRVVECPLGLNPIHPMANTNAQHVSVRNGVYYVCNMGIYLMNAALTSITFGSARTVIDTVLMQRRWYGCSRSSLTKTLIIIVRHSGPVDSTVHRSKPRVLSMAIPWLGRGQHHDSRRQFHVKQRYTRFSGRYRVLRCLCF